MISSAREQVTQYLEQQAQHLIGGLENSASGWIERILHEANKVISHIPVVGSVTQAAEGVLHEVNKR